MDKHEYFQFGNACITSRYYGPDCFVKFPDGIRRISGREYAALINIIKEKNAGDEKKKGGAE